VRLPPGFTLFPGAKVLSSTVVEREGEQRALVVFETLEPVGGVMASYRDQARAAGLEPAVDLGGSERASLGGRLPSGRTVTISARRESGLTRVEFAHQ
jgi:hypothetical protein